MAKTYLLIQKLKKRAKNKNVPLIYLLEKYKNMTDWESDDDIVAPDCGIGFVQKGAADLEWGDTTPAISSHKNNAAVDDDDDWGIDAAKENALRAGRGGGGGYGSRDDAGERGGRRYGGNREGGGGFERRERRNSGDRNEEGVESLLKIPDNYEMSTVQEFLQKVQIFDFTTPLTAKKLHDYLMNVYKIYIQKEYNEEFSAERQSLIETEINVPLSHADLYKEIDAFLVQEEDKITHVGGKEALTSAENTDDTTTTAYSSVQVQRDAVGGSSLSSQMLFLSQLRQISSTENSAHLTAAELSSNIMLPPGADRDAVSNQILGTVVSEQLLSALSGIPELPEFVSSDLSSIHESVNETTAATSRERLKRNLAQKAAAATAAPFDKPTGKVITSTRQRRSERSNLMAASTNAAATIAAKVAAHQRRRDLAEIEYCEPSYEGPLPSITPLPVISIERVSALYPTKLPKLNLEYQLAIWNIGTELPNISHDTLAASSGGGGGGAAAAAAIATNGAYSSSQTSSSSNSQQLARRQPTERELHERLDTNLAFDIAAVISSSLSNDADQSVVIALPQDIITSSAAADAAVLVNDGITAAVMASSEVNNSTVEGHPRDILFDVSLVERSDVADTPFITPIRTHNLQTTSTPREEVTIVAPEQQISVEITSSGGEPLVENITMIENVAPIVENIAVASGLPHEEVVIVAPEQQDAVAVENLSTTTTTNGLPQQEVAVIPPEQPQISNRQTTTPPQQQEDGYRRNWYDTLRARIENVEYADLYISPQRRPRRRRRRRNSPVAGQPAPAQLNEAQQVLAALIPPILLEPPSLQPETINLSNVSQPTVLETTTNEQLQIPQIEVADLMTAAPPPPPISSQSDIQANARTAAQSVYDTFLLENSEAIVTLVDNLSLVREMLIQQNMTVIENSKTSTMDGHSYTTLPASYTFDPDLILQEDPVKLQIKLSILRALICQQKVDIGRCEFIRTRFEAATAFGFLLDLKTMNLINLSSDGRIFSMRGRRGGGGYRNRESGDDGEGGGGRRRYGDGEGGGRRKFGDGDGDFNNNKGEDGEDGLPEKPREFYIPPEPTNDEDEMFNTGITSGINFSKYENIPVKVSGENVPPSITGFNNAGLRAIILENVTKSNYKVPTPIQKVAIPVISSGRDLMACAQTGSGKTAAFLLPILSSLLEEGKDMVIGKPQAVIISPTRELAVQIFNEARKFAHGSYLKISIVYGGTSFKYQNENVAKGFHVLIATPGRLMDFVNRTFITFEDTRFVVLDEADRMLDMGFLDTVTGLMRHQTMCPERQVLMFSATFPEDIQRLAGEFLTNYIFVAVGVVGGACSDVKQNIMEVNKFNKRSKLLELLREDADGTIVFVETKRGADFLASFFSETEFPTTSIHGDRLQSQRETALRDFKTGSMKVLIATSVASRGLDIKNVKHVINYDMPQAIDDYVHRIGRTGRVGNNGRATSFFDPDTDGQIAGDLVKILEGANQEVPDFLRQLSSGGGGYGGGSNFGGIDVRGNNGGDGALEVEADWD